MRVKQVSVFVENKPGRFMAVLEALEKDKINIHGLSVSDATDIGIVRMILTDPDKALADLKRAGFTVRTDWVVSAELPDVPGGLLHHVARPLSDAGVNLLYLYVYTDSTTGKTIAVVKTDDLDKAEKVLGRN